MALPAKKQQLSDDEMHYSLDGFFHRRRVPVKGSIKGTAQEVMAALSADEAVIKVVAIECKGGDENEVAEAFCSAVRIGVERVRLEVYSPAGLGSHHLERMAAALNHPDCNVWVLDLILLNADATPVVTLLASTALEHTGSTLLKLALKCQSVVDLRRLTQALRGPNCRLQCLVYNGPAEGISVKDILTGTNITCLWMNVNGIILGFEGPLLEALQSGECKLRHLHCFRASPESQRAIVDWLEANPGGSHLEQLDFNEWESNTLKEYCAKVLVRNKRYRDAGLLDDQVEVSTAKLFMCGHSGVGKTTITRNLVRTLCFGLPACLQRHRSTYGIDVHPLKFPNGQRLLVCDLAGQDEYHSFHHYFVRGSDKDIFAVVCRGPSGSRDQSRFRNELHYWLRFIAAHRGVSSNKLPRVIIVLNYFQDSDRGVQAQDRCNDLVTSYKEVIQFAGILGLVGTSYSNVQALKKMLGNALADLLEAHRPKMPQVSQKFLEAKKKILNAKPNKSEKYTIELASLVKEVPLGIAVDDALIKLCLLHLHDMGELLYFENQSSQTPGEQLVILDFQWFVREVIGIFVPRLSRSTQEIKRPPSSMKIVDAELKLKRVVGDGKHTKYLMDILQTMGVLIIDEQAQDVQVLALLTEKFKGWQFRSEENVMKYWGRRFACQDENVTLLPSGIFAMLQVRLGDLFNHKVGVGNGWIYTARNFVDAVVMIGGKTGDWHDRHWINVLMRFPEDRISDASDILTQVKDTIMDICSAIHWGCPALELDEWVINPAVVKVIEQVDSSEEKDMIEILVKEAIKEGSLGYGHTWNQSLECTPLKELLTPDEQRSCKEKYLEPHLLKIVSLDNLEHEVKDHLIKVTQDEGSGMSALENVTFATKSEEIIFKLLKENNGIMRENNRISREILSVATETLHEVKGVKRLIEVKSNEILSLLLLKFDTRLPKYPYLTRSDSIFQTFFGEKVAGSSWRVRFLCEYGINCHEVEGQQGIWHTEMPSWLRESAPVLVPALKLLFFTGKLAATAALGPNFLPSADPYLKRLADAAVGPVLDKVFGSIDQSLVTALQLRGNQGIQQVELSQFCDKILEGKNIEAELGLYKVTDGRSITWVCGAHKFGK